MSNEPTKIVLGLGTVNVMAAAFPGEGDSVLLFAPKEASPIGEPVPDVAGRSEETLGATVRIEVRNLAAAEVLLAKVKIIRDALYRAEGTRAEELDR